MKICSHCGGQVVKEDAKFCNLCGKKLEQEQIGSFCSKCGNEIADANAKFCIKCGESIAKKEKKAQRGGFAITGLAMAIYVIVLIVANVDGVIRMQYEPGIFWANIMMWGIPVILGLMFSITAVKKCHGALKVISIIGIVANSVLIVCLLIIFGTATMSLSCISSSSSNVYDYYY